MESETRSVLTADLFGGVIAVAMGVFVGGPTAMLVTPLVGVVMAAVTATALYIVEHDSVPGLYPEVTALASMVVLVCVGGAFVLLLDAPTDIVMATALAGGGVGLLVYRTVFGVVLPVPTYRLEKQQ